MNLVQVKDEAPKSDTSAITLSDEAAALADIQTTAVSLQAPVKEVTLYGTVQADERRWQSQTAHITGRVEKLYVTFTGEAVHRGQVLATLYSPELLAAQQELEEAQRMQSVRPELLQAAREKLKLLKLSDEEIARMEQGSAASSLTDVVATTDGVVMNRRVSVGDYVSRGERLYDVADLSHVWLLFDAYESDLPFLKTGNTVNYTLRALPEKRFSGRIAFISPVIDPATRTAKVRVDASNASGELKPDMYAVATVQAVATHADRALVIPRSAVLWTGRRSIVYVKQPHTSAHTFQLREVELGASLGDSYVITSGIQAGDEVVTNGVFAIDADAQLSGKPSMI
jgi:Cu(I)/Ag(I) efflux system membrane fusion protein